MISPAPRCIREELTDYAAGRLTAVRRNHWDLHLVTCPSCRAEVEGERRLQQVLRLDTVAVPDQLRSALLALAARPADGVPAVPLAPAGVRSAVSALPLATLSPDAPAAHRSMVRPALLATIAASAGAAAAIGLSIGTLAAPASQVAPQLRPAAPATTSTSGVGSPVAFRPGWSPAVLRVAESTP